MVEHAADRTDDLRPGAPPAGTEERRSAAAHDRRRWGEPWDPVCHRGVRTITDLHVDPDHVRSTAGHGRSHPPQLARVVRYLCPQLHDGHGHSSWVVMGTVPTEDFEVASDVRTINDGCMASL
jgi:hypothetical protein